ncbi:hypothetical protein SO802_032513 [Lithocarpus litseifolius]|uniref:Uncharacterized protein n=1 Tax=Lithocarpus litseifolius TaxID=425828 RepID=A0AAW2BBT8_9ROSI
MAEDMAKQDDGLAIDLYNYTMSGEWGKVVEMYEEHKTKAISARINTSGDTALHVAVSIAPEKKVRQLVRVIFGVSELGLWTKNNKGNTPLHVAASTGRLKTCILLAAKLDESLEVKDSVVQEFFRNDAGESALFLAAFHGHKPNFLCLDSLRPSRDLKPGQSNPLYRRKDGDTILHCAIRWEYFDLAFEILELDHTLAYSVNELGITPLHLLASKPSVFKSCCHLKLDWKSIIYHCTWVKELKEETATEELNSSVEENFGKSSWPKFQKICQECIDAGITTTKRKHVHSVKIMDILIARTREKNKYFNFSSGRDPGQTSLAWKHQQEPSAVQATDASATASKTDQQHKSNGTETDSEKKENEKGNLLIPISSIHRKEETSEMEKIERAVLLAAQNGITDTVKKILKEIPMAINVKSEGKEEKIKTPILLAAENGITEMVVKILKMTPMAINDESNNIVLLAAKNRQTHVLRVLFKLDFVKRKLIHEVDANGNNALHLAAELGLGVQEPWVIPGAAYCKCSGKSSGMRYELKTNFDLDFYY